MQNDKKNKYFLYVRKSSETEDRQVLSIESQIKELKELAKKSNLSILEVFIESKSAKAPGRPIFNEMIQKIHNNGAQGIICWKLDRLARNPIDGGQVSWMLQKELIKHIKTFTRDYFPQDNVLMMNVEFGMANQFIRDLSQNTKRGLRAKAEKGWLPGIAPLGYLNNKYKPKNERNIIKDPEKFNLVRKMWDLLLTGRYSIQKIGEIASNKFGLKSRLTNKGLHKSKIYYLFNNPFYYGYFKYNDKLYKGKHQPMISKEEFRLGQAILGNKRKPRLKTHSFAFTGMIKCKECGAMITAEEKIKRQKNGNIHFYTYYRCTKKKNARCTQKAIRKESLEKQISSMLEAITIPHTFYNWVIKRFESESKKDIADRNQILKTQRKNYDNCIKNIDKLIEMRMNEEITQEEFLKKKNDLSQEKTKLESLFSDTGRRVTKWFEKAEIVLSFARDAQEKFRTGTLEDKKIILSTLGSNLFLENKKLSISIETPLILIGRVAQEVNEIYRRLEPLKKSENELNFEKIYSKSSILGG